MQREHGQDWRVVAADLDGAVYEWGHFVEGKAEKAVRRLYDAARKDGGEVTDADVERVADVQISYWVHGWVKEYFVTAAVGKFGGASYVLQRRATYDREADARPMSTKDRDVQKVTF